MAISFGISQKDTRIWQFRWHFSSLQDIVSYILSLFSAWNKFLLESILFLLVLLNFIFVGLALLKVFCQCARLREEKEEEINFSWMQFYFEGPLIFDRKAHFLFEGMDLHPQPPQRNSQLRDSSPWLDRNKQILDMGIEPLTFQINALWVTNYTNWSTFTSRPKLIYDISRNRTLDRRQHCRT